MQTFNTQLNSNKADANHTHSGYVSTNRFEYYILKLLNYRIFYTIDPVYFINEGYSDRCVLCTDTSTSSSGFYTFEKTSGWPQSSYIDYSKTFRMSIFLSGEELQAPVIADSVFVNGVNNTNSVIINRGSADLQFTRFYGESGPILLTVMISTSSTLYYFANQHLIAYITNFSLKS